MSLLIYGSKDFALTVAELARHCGYKVAGMVDDYDDGPGILGDLDFVSRTHPPQNHGFVVAIGYSNISARWKAWERIRALGYQAPVLIHPRAYVADSATIGCGSIVMAGAIVDVRADIGELVVIWPGVCVNHDVVVGENTFLSPSSTLCGFVNIGRDSFVGAGTTIADRCEVPASSFLKMQTRYTGK